MPAGCFGRSVVQGRPSGARTLFASGSGTGRMTDAERIWELPSRGLGGLCAIHLPPRSHVLSPGTLLVSFVAERETEGGGPTSAIPSERDERATRFREFTRMVPLLT
ncbi:hypothetical protein HPB48_004969 [Haemaphysalis longicornis]|uniref:Uncharacterized protein n=1 Tax=Haemaphysalis longicornis TaxID=44386 RepID=A0A9J6GFH0_HAELO|nr:hypothetical protein HPB48_004969 [Haemaphysalis longicornis]